MSLVSSARCTSAIKKDDWEIYSIQALRAQQRLATTCIATTLAKTVLFRKYPTSLSVGSTLLFARCIPHTYLLYYVRSCNRSSIIERSADHGVFGTIGTNFELGTVSVR